MTTESCSIENSGENSGAIVGNNYGSIVLNMQNVVKIPSLISELVRLLGDACCEEEYATGGGIIKTFKPDEKIKYNCVIKYKCIIEEFSEYYSTCESYLNAYDDSNIRGKAKILKCVHMWYLEAKGLVLSENKASSKDELDIIRDNSDRIIDMVKDKMISIIQDSGDMDITYREDFELGIACFICYCFMECKILEKPL